MERSEVHAEICSALGTIRVTARRDAANRPSDGYVACRVGGEAKMGVGGSPEAALGAFVLANPHLIIGQVQVGWYSPACGCRYCQERRRREEKRDE